MAFVTHGIDRNGCRPGNRRARLRVGLSCIVVLACCFAATAAGAADATLIAAAKKEGEVVWYTTQIISQLVRPVSAAFEKKYGIKVRALRANSTETSVKIINESRAGKPQSDVFDGTSTVVPLKKEGYVLQWLPDPDRKSTRLNSSHMSISYAVF